MEITPQPLGPLDQTDAFAVEILVEPEFRCVVSPTEAIEVEVVEPEPSRVFIQDGERRAGDRKRWIDTETHRHPSGKLGLAASEFAGERDKGTDTEQSAKPRSKGNCFFDVVGEKSDQVTISPSSGSGRFGR